MNDKTQTDENPDEKRQTGKKKAMFWERSDDDSVRCLLCPQLCNIAEGKTGLCGARKNCEASLVASGYGQISSVALDPIEKKPLYMYFPGTQILSIGSYGCNLRCPFCQNHEISMPARNDFHSGFNAEAQNSNTAEDENVKEQVSPDNILALAVRTIPEGNIGVAYTYNEPFINIEYLLDCAKAVHSIGLKNIVVTNGYINTKPLEKALPLIDAMNIDLKGFTESFYKNLGGSLNPVMETISMAIKYCHVEITTLIIPGENENDIEELSKWLASLDPNIPLHLSRFFPRFKYADKTPTPRETIYKMQDVAKKHLLNVFTGNM